MPSSEPDRDPSSNPRPKAPEKKPTVLMNGAVVLSCDYVDLVVERVALWRHGRNGGTDLSTVDGHPQQSRARLNKDGAVTGHTGEAVLKAEGTKEETIFRLLRTSRSISKKSPARSSGALPGSLPTKPSSLAFGSNVCRLMRVKSACSRCSIRKNSIYRYPRGPSRWIGYMPILMITLVTMLLIYLMLRRMGGASSPMAFGRSRGKMYAQEDWALCSTDVAGIDGSGRRSPRGRRIPTSP